MVCCTGTGVLVRQHAGLNPAYDHRMLAAWRLTIDLAVWKPDEIGKALYLR